MYMRKISLTVLLACCMATAMAQRTEKVHGTYSYTVGENEKTSVAEIKNKCIMGARNAAIKDKFHEHITDITRILDTNINGNTFTEFIEELEAQTNAEWIEDIHEPVITATYENGQLTFTAEVSGKASEIKQASYDVSWDILNGGKSENYRSNKFHDGDRIFIRFRSPVSGYLALYVIDSVNKAAECWLPYKTDPTGYFHVEANRDYILFDPDSDHNALKYILGTDNVELDNVVMIFSPTPFTKCSEIDKGSKEVNAVPLKDFEKWLSKKRSSDDRMMVDRTKFITIINENVSK